MLMFLLLLLFGLKIATLILIKNILNKKISLNKEVNMRSINKKTRIIMVGLLSACFLFQLQQIIKHINVSGNSDVRITVIDSKLSDKSYFKDNNIPINEISGVQQLLATIKNNNNDIEVVDLFAHSNAEKIIIGNDVITLDNIDNYQQTLHHIGQSLANNAHINLLGCDIAQTDKGKLLVDKFAQYTGVSVAASVDQTSMPALKGDWDLEYITHDNKTKLAQLPFIYQSYPAILSHDSAYVHPTKIDPSTTDTDGDGVMDDIDVDDDNDGILDAIERDAFCVVAGTNYIGPTYFS